AERIFGILPNCSHPHCLGCLRTWRKSRGDFPLGVINQIRCRFFMRGNGRCPFKSDCIYLHQLPDKASSSDPSWPGSMQLASPEEEVFFMNCALTMAFWGSELFLDPNSSYHYLL
ncbi:hypothetical protein E2I00_000674, partial [Balaenoptera physalus]